MDGSWRWPLANSQELIEIKSLLPLISSGREDRITWKSNNLEIFCLNMAWDILREKKSLVPWKNILWFKSCIQRHSIILRLAIKGRLNTKDKLSQFAIINDAICSFCEDSMESLDHLFFSCQVTRRLWDEILSWSGLEYEYASWRNYVSFSFYFGSLII